MAVSILVPIGSTPKSTHSSTPSLFAVFVGEIYHDEIAGTRRRRRRRNAPARPPAPPRVPPEYEDDDDGGNNRAGGGLPNGQSRPITLEDVRNVAALLAAQDSNNSDDDYDDDDDDDDDSSTSSEWSELNLSWYERWENHMFLQSMKDLSLFLQGNRERFFIFSGALWLGLYMIPFGFVMGGFAVGAVEWIIDNIILFYLPHWTLYLLILVVIVGGPEILPPLTLVNGCETLIVRVFWVGVFVLFDLFTNYFVEGRCIAYNIMLIASAIWHMDRSDHDFKHLALHYQRDRDRALECSTEILTSFASNHFRAASGVGMLLAVCGVYSLGASIKALLIYVFTMMAYPFVAPYVIPYELKNEIDEIRQKLVAIQRILEKEK